MTAIKPAATKTKREPIRFNPPPLSTEPGITLESLAKQRRAQAAKPAAALAKATGFGKPAPACEVVGTHEKQDKPVPDAKAPKHRPAVAVRQSIDARKLQQKKRKALDGEDQLLLVSKAHGQSRMVEVNITGAAFGSSNERHVAHLQPAEVTHGAPQHPLGAVYRASPGQLVRRVATEASPLDGCHRLAADKASCDRSHRPAQLSYEPHDSGLSRGLSGPGGEPWIGTGPLSIEQTAREALRRAYAQRGGLLASSGGGGAEPPLQHSHTSMHHPYNLKAAPSFDELEPGEIGSLRLAAPLRHAEPEPGPMRGRRSLDGPGPQASAQTSASRPGSSLFPGKGLGEWGEALPGLWVADAGWGGSRGPWGEEGGLLLPDLPMDGTAIAERIATARSAPALLALLRGVGPLWEPRHVSAAAWRAMELCPADDMGQHPLNAQACLGSLSSLGYLTKTGFKAQLEHRLGQQVVEALGKAAGACLGRFPARGCVDLARALAALRCGALLSELLDDLAQQAALAVMREARRLAPGHLAALASAYRALRHVPPTAFLDTLQMVALDKAPEFEPPEACELLTAFAALRFQAAPALAEALGTAAAPGAAALPRLGDVVDALGALHQLSAPLPNVLLNAAARRFAEEAEGLDLGQMAAFLQLYGRLMYTPGLPALSAAARALEAITPEAADPSDVVQLVWAFASLSFNPGPGVLSIAVEAALMGLPALEPAALADLVWALATLCFSPGPALLGAVSVATQAMMGALPAPVLARLLWALLAFRACEPGLLGAFSATLTALPLQDYDAGALEETFAAHLLAGGASGGGLALPGDLMAAAWRAWGSAAALQRAQRAPLLREVSGVLAGMGIHHNTDVEGADANLRLDIAFETAPCLALLLLCRPDVSVGVRAPLGRVALRRRLLEAAGFTVLYLPFWEWEELQHDPHARAVYLKQLLSRV